eukprot:TRINITY_DN2731_c0_g1_i2.p1 TRINITY_DN2731_c0_g1~~TRINITY_DN2731_c0_g1_i2.p1  ORF type:complete len:555 (-),score=136.15 TRINITY_DN2731_c0_g1_i2:961-2625(-)
MKAQAAGRPASASRPLSHRSHQSHSSSPRKPDSQPRSQSTALSPRGVIHEPAVMMRAPYPQDAYQYQQLQQHQTNASLQAAQHMAGKLQDLYSKKLARIQVQVPPAQRLAAVSELTMWYARQCAENLAIARRQQTQLSAAAAQANAIVSTGCTVTSNVTRVTPPSTTTVTPVSSPSHPLPTVNVARPPASLEEAVRAALASRGTALSKALNACTQACAKAATNADVVMVLRNEMPRVRDALTETIPSFDYSAEEDATNALLLVEDHMFVFDKCGQRAWQHYVESNAANDEIYLRKCKYLSDAKPAELGVRPKFALLDDSVFTSAIAALRRLMAVVTPTSRLQCASTCQKELCGAVDRFFAKRDEQDAGLLGADDLLPLLSVVVTRAAVPNLHAHMALMADFISEDAMLGEAGYTFVTLQTTLAFIMGLVDHVAPSSPPQQRPTTAAVADTTASHVVIDFAGATPDIIPADADVITDEQAPAADTETKSAAEESRTLPPVSVPDVPVDNSVPEVAVDNTGVKVTALDDAEQEHISETGSETIALDLRRSRDSVDW